MQSGAGSTFGFKSSVFFAILATSSNTTALWTASAASFPRKLSHGRRQEEISLFMEPNMQTTFSVRSRVQET